MATASGFICNKCKSDELQTILSKDVVHIIELQCNKCKFVWAVERAHVGGYREPEGRVHE